MTTTTIPGRARADGLAIASFILSVLWLGGLGGLLGIILGLMSRSYARQDGKLPSGLATAGVILGVIGLAAVIITVIAIASSQPDPTQQWINCLDRQVNDPTIYCPSPS